MSNVLLHSLQFSCSEMPIAQFSSILLQPALLPVHCSSQYYMYSHSNNRFTVHTTKSIHYQASLNTAYRCLVSVCDCFVCDSKSLLSLLSLNLVASSSFLVASSTTFRLNIPWHNYNYVLPHYKLQSILYMFFIPLELLQLSSVAFRFSICLHSTLP